MNIARFLKIAFPKKHLWWLLLLLDTERDVDLNELILILINNLRSSPRRCSLRKGVLRNFAKFRGKHLCQSLFFNKIIGLMPQVCNFIQKETMAQVFSCKFCEISKNTFFTKQLQENASAV